MRILALALCIAACVNDAATGTSRDPLLFASGPKAFEVLAMAPTLRGMDHRAIDCGAPVSEAGILTCSLLVACALPIDVSLVSGGIEFPGDAELFTKCLMTVSAAEIYVAWLMGRQLSPRDLAPAYNKLKGLFSTRIEKETAKRAYLPAPSWTSHG